MTKIIYLIAANNLLKIQKSDRPPQMRAQSFNIDFSSNQIASIPSNAFISPSATDSAIWLEHNQIKSINSIWHL